MSISYLDLYTGQLECAGDKIQTVDPSESPPIANEYSVSLWLFIRRSLAGRQVVLLSKGKEGESQPRMMLHERSLCIKFDTERTGKESLFSSNDLPLRSWVNVVFTLKEEGVTEANLYLDGHLDSQISTKNPLVLNTGKFYLGKDPWNHGFLGSLADAHLFYHALSARDVAEMCSFGRANWESTGEFNSIGALYVRAQESTSSTLPRSTANLKMLGNVSVQPTKRQGSYLGSSRSDRLAEYFRQNPKMYPRVTCLASNFDWLFTFYRVLRCTLPNYRDEHGNVLNLIEVDRMMPALYEIELKFTKQEILALAKVTKTWRPIEYGPAAPGWNELTRDDLIEYAEFLETLRNYVEFPEMEEFPTPEPEEKHSHLYEAVDDFIANKTASFEICVDFCTKCSAHQTTTWHDENEYVGWFN